MEWIIGLLAAIVLIYIVLPKLLNRLGVHKHYEIPNFDLKNKRALIVTTSHSVLGNSGKSTGVFASEMTVPYYAFINAGLHVDIASIKGGKIPVEAESMRWPLATPEDKRFKKDAEALQKLNNSLVVKELNANDYDVIFMAGGWGAAYDLAQSDELAKLITQANANGSILGSVCHGALGLVNAKDTDGSPLVEGRRVSGVTDKQLKQLGVQMTPLHPETELRKKNAKFEAKSAMRDMFATYVAVDGNLVTGQNQNSGAEAAHRILEILATKA